MLLLVPKGKTYIFNYMTYKRPYLISAKYYMLRAFPEISSKLIIIRKLETTNVIRNVTSIMALTV